MLTKTSRIQFAMRNLFSQAKRKHEQKGFICKFIVIVANSFQNITWEWEGGDETRSGYIQGIQPKVPECTTFMLCACT